MLLKDYHNTTRNTPVFAFDERTVRSRLRYSASLGCTAGGTGSVDESSGYDVVIVGGGPAGCVLANRLSVNPDRSVLMIEAGPDYGAEPGNWPAELLYPEAQAFESHSWGLRDAVSGIFLPRARVIGGASAVNACYWIRGSKADYDAWEALGNTGWGFENLLPFFRMAESDPLGGPLHGTDGLVPIYRAADWSAGDAAFVEAAAAALGLEEIEDINGAAGQFPSVGPAPRNIGDGMRVSGAMSYLAPARNRPNLTLQPQTPIDRIVFEGPRATGVITQAGRTIPAGLVILTAGAYFTPGLLNRSGIGDETGLRALDIPVHTHLPGVGKNLLDHPLAVMVMQGALAPGAEPDRQLLGPTMAKGRAASSDTEIDYHVYNGQDFDPTLDRWIFHASLSLMHSRSTGSVRLASADPATLPIIEHRHYADPADLERMCAAAEFARALFQTDPLAELLEPVPERGWTWSNRAELHGLIRQRVESTNHCSGTAKMGPASDPLAVVDLGGRVYGTEGLIVADSSIFPTCPRANIHFPVVAAAEKIAATLA